MLAAFHSQIIKTEFGIRGLRGSVLFLPAVITELLETIFTAGFAVGACRMGRFPLLLSLVVAAKELAFNKAIWSNDLV